MKKTLALALFLAVFTLAQTNTNQTTITAHVAVNVSAGQTACLEGIPPVGIVPCDNTVSNPAAAIGVFLTSGTAGSHGTEATIAVNGNVLASVPMGTGCSAGDLVGDIDGSGNLGDLGAPSTVSGPVSYVGICESPNVNETALNIIVQPGYVF